MMSRMAMALSGAAAIGLPNASDTAPASMSSWGVAISFTFAVFVLFRSNAMKLVPFAVIMPLDKVTPPALAPASRTCILDASRSAAPSASLNVTFMTPSPFLYQAEIKTGGAVSLVEMVWSVTAATGLFTASSTAPASMSSWGVVMAFTMAVFVLFRSNVMERVPLAVIMPLDRVTPPALTPASRTWIFEALCAAVFSGSSNVTVRMPAPVEYAAETNCGGATSYTSCTGMPLFVPKTLPPLTPMRTVYVILSPPA